MLVRKESSVNRRIGQFGKDQHEKLEDIMFCLGYLQDQASQAGFSEIADLIGVTRLAGDDIANEMSAVSKKAS